MRGLRTLVSLLPVTGLRWRNLLWPVLAGTMTLLSALTLTVVSAWLIARAWEMPPVLDLTVAVTAVRALGISRAAFRYVDRLVAHGLALRCAATTRVATYRALADAPPASVASLGRGDVTTRLTDDIDAVSDVIVRAVIPALVSLVTGVVAVAFMALLSVPAAVVLAVGLLVAGVAAPWAVSRSVRLAESRRAHHAQQYVSAVDRVLTDPAALRVRGQLDPVLQDAQTTAHELTQADEAGAPSRAAGAALAVAASAGTALGVLLVAVTGYATGGVATYSPQWFGVMVLLSLAAFEATSRLSDAAVSVVRASGAADRLSGLFRSIPDCPYGPNGAHPSAGTGPEPSLSGTDVTYGRDTALGTMNLDLPFGSFRALTAPSGSGKTTMLMTLAGLIPPYEGRVLLDGRDLRDLASTDAESLHRTVAYLPEDARIFATTVRDNLAVGAPAAEDDLMHEVLEAVGLEDWVGSLPSGLSTLLPAGADSLSGGERRRLLIARMLLTDAPILLLDEPFEHLDHRGAQALETLLSTPILPGARDRRTVVITRHPRDGH
ncbi:MAG: thiol reductant ABC exporter subunit CydC [Corynebacterium sp.]|uniref:thiol reductant ABC exporter subunit CydC n=1 Tax=unclassified Corynebacterium TaxID=2624378 RepID=UPI00096228D7|nr:thiol reductant ABC exporter subunit CydC [Corynebacterium sp. CNJ-954]OLT53691.1 thiol reductant ABC exporter subunit CydC [Corynebacterium sp. CNJ-954]